MLVRNAHEITAMIPTELVISINGANANTTDMSPTQDEPTIWTWLAEHIPKYVSAVLLLVGLPGNTLSFAVMLKAPFRGTSCGLLLAVLSLVDSALLVVGALTVYLPIWYGPETLGCVALPYVAHCLAGMSSSTIALITAERLVVVVAPLRAASICSLRNTAIVITSLVVFSIGIDIPHLFLKMHDGTSCTYTDIGKKIYSVLPVTRAWLLFVLPYIWIVLANLVIIIVLCRANRRWRDGRRRSDRSSIQSVTTRMLVVVSTTFLVMTGPLCVSAMILGHVKTSAFLHTFLMLRKLLTTLYITNSAINFYLYCLTGRKFRQALLQLLKSSCHQGRNGNVELSYLKTIAPSEESGGVL